jgi:ankyrin repeat protein
MYINLSNINKIDISLDNYFIEPYKLENLKNVENLENFSVYDKNDESDLNNILKTLTSIIMSNNNPILTDIKLESDKIQSPTFDTSIFKLVANNKISDIKKNISVTNINIQDNDGDTPLHIAVFMCNSEICKILLDNNADFTIRDKWGQFPLHRICFCINNIDIFKIISYFVNVNYSIKNINIFNQIDNYGNTPFHLVLKYLLKNNINITEYHVKLINKLKKNTDCKIKNIDNYSIYDLLKELNL